MICPRATSNHSNEIGSLQIHINHEYLSYSFLFFDRREHAYKAECNNMLCGQICSHLCFTAVPIKSFVSVVLLQVFFASNTAACGIASVWWYLSNSPTLGVISFPIKSCACQQTALLFLTLIGQLGQEVIGKDCVFLGLSGQWFRWQCW